MVGDFLASDTAVSLAEATNHRVASSFAAARPPCAASLTPSHLEAVGDDLGQVVHRALVAVLVAEVGRLLAGLLHQLAAVCRHPGGAHPDALRYFEQARHAARVHQLVWHLLLGHHTHCVAAPHRQARACHRLDSLERVLHLAGSAHKVTTCARCKRESGARASGVATPGQRLAPWVLTGVVLCAARGRRRA